MASATEALERRLRLAPKDPVAHKDVAGLSRQGEPSRRSRLSTPPSRSTLADADVHAAIGGIRLDAGLPAEAILALRRAIDLVPTFYEARYPLALALRQTGRATRPRANWSCSSVRAGKRPRTRRRTMTAEVKREEAARQDDPR